MANDRLINSSQGDSIISELRAMNTNLADIKSAIAGDTEFNAKFIYNNTANFGITGTIETITIPSGFTAIATEAFLNCFSLKNIIIADTITSINSKSFGNCTALTSIEIPSNVTTIASTAFYNCTNLTTITIHKSQDSIPDAPWGAINATVTWTG